MKVLNNHESHYIKDIEDHTHPHGRHFKAFEVISAQKAKNTKKYVEVSTYDFKVSTPEDILESENKVSTLEDSE